VGEKVPKADEGAFGCRVNVAQAPGTDAFQRITLAKNVFDRSCNAPLIRLRHLLPPQKARGEKALEGKTFLENKRDKTRA
jgi:hypothetical protein